MNQATPPSWAEEVLRILLPPRDRDSVRGDLIEEYRERIEASREKAAADLWYLRQVADFAYRSVGFWAFAFAVLFVGRGVVDGLVTTDDFTVRAGISTVLTATAWVCCGATVAWRTGLIRSGALAGIVAATVAPLMTGSLNVLFYSSVMLTGSDQIFVNVARAGGIGEAFTLPFFIMGPGMVLAAIGGVLGGTARRVQSIAFPAQML